MVRVKCLLSLASEIASLFQSFNQVLGRKKSRAFGMVGNYNEILGPKRRSIMKFSILLYLEVVAELFMKKP